MFLHYGFAGLKTKRIVFEDVFTALDSACLAQLKELSAKRRLIEESINDTSRITEATAREMAGGLTSRNQQEILRLEQYLPLLQNLIIQIDSVSDSRCTNRWISELRVRWTSILGSSSTFKLNGPKYFQINSLKYELGMVLFLYGVTLHELAFEVLEDLQKSASLLKKSAGVFNYLNTDVLPSLQDILPPEKPPEATANVSSAMSLFCLAEAQAVAIKMAEKKQMSPALLAKLHYGVTQFLDEACGFLQSGSRDISEKFMDFIISCRNLHELRSRRHLAESCKELNQLGVAIGLLNCALNNKNDMPGNQSWRDVFKSEVTEISELLKKYNKENEIVWHEQIPLDFELPPMEGRKIVTTTPYDPERWERQLAFKT
ncbi:uncharacterized protein LOC141623508 isoform X1 [Silene latifolia]|uniref:uncharacterized protein LOC141623508 isoform X1 n=1 Tax=Silene latifolia TaxID=37657 RepID=UPI003D76FB36